MTVGEFSHSLGRKRKFAQSFFQQFERLLMAKAAVQRFRGNILEIT